MSSQVPDTQIGSTCIYFMDAHDPDSFITIGNAKNRFSYNRSLAMEWIYTKRVGVMIASNLGRPGGACSQITVHNKFEFIPHPLAKTQEESVLTFIHSIVPQRGQTHYLEKQLKFILSVFGMDIPTGDRKTDFIVKNKINGRQFDVRRSNNPNDYDREIGSTIIVEDSDTNLQHKIYISFIAGPNASSPRNNDWTPRCAIKRGRFLQFDTMFRTISMPATADYDLFREMTLVALVSSLKKMAVLDYKYVIMASPSSGIYAGWHKSKVQQEYHKLCMQALQIVYSSTSHRFDGVIIPKY